MHGLFFHVRPKPGHMAQYFAHVERLKPVLARHRGLVFLDRYRPLDEPEALLSHQLWADEAAIAAWRADPTHRASQEAGRRVHFEGYRIRVGAELPGAEGPGRYLLAAYGPAALTLPGGRAHESVTRAGRFLTLAATDRAETAQDMTERARAQGAETLRLFRVDRDYTMTDRAEVPPRQAPPRPLHLSPNTAILPATSAPRSDMNELTQDIPALMEAIGRRASSAAAELSCASPEAKTRALEVAAERVEARRGEILAANETDMAFGRDKGLSAAMLDRLKLDAGRIAGITAGLRAVAAQDDPVGAVMAEWDQPSGLHIQRVRTPLGVIGVIYESRPNVTADAGALCLKSGNAVILRGGSESFQSSGLLVECLRAGLAAAGLPEDAVQLVPTRDRAAVRELLGMTAHVDVIVPRGGKGLVGLVQAEARVPVFAHLEGICHVYIDAAADAGTALKVVLNAKTRRTGICGAAECLLIHRDVVDTIGQGVVKALLDAGVEVRGDAQLQAIAGVVPATAEDWGREYLDMIIAARVVGDIDAAIDHVRTHGSGHTESILTEDDAAATRFFQRLDSAILMRNASTQFADGGEFGMGAEIGIATGKLHARGPVGAEQLTSFKYLVTGQGTTRP